MSGFWELYWTGLVFVLGLCMGSFLNVCICRIPAEKSVVFPPSACPKCGNRIKWFDNIPVLSWLLLRARCRHCRLPISPVYPVVELVTAVLFLAIWFMYGPSATAAVYALAAFGLLLGTGVDLKEMWLPDRVTIGGMILFPIFSALVPELHQAEGAVAGLTASVIGLAAGFGLFWMIREVGSAAMKKEAMGFGDVKLMGALGALFGWQSILYITFVSAMVGSVIGVTVILLQRRGIHAQIPFGPYLTLAAFSWMLGGWRLWDSYLALMGF